MQLNKFVQLQKIKRKKKRKRKKMKKKEKSFVSAVTKTQARINGDTNVPYTTTAANQTHEQK